MHSSNSVKEAAKAVCQSQGGTVMDGGADNVHKVKQCHPKGGTGHESAKSPGVGKSIPKGGA